MKPTWEVKGDGGQGAGAAGREEGATSVLERSGLRETEAGAGDWRLQSREGWRWKPWAPGCLCPGDAQRSVLSHVTPLQLPSWNHMDKSKRFLLSVITPLALSTYRVRILLAE